VLRETISRLSVWDAVAHAQTTLEAGAVLEFCRVYRNDATVMEGEGDAYQVKFHSAGHQYTCPLYRFQPRTRLLELVSVEAIPAREAVAV